MYHIFVVFTVSVQLQREETVELRGNYGLLKKEKKTLKLFVHGLAQMVLKFIFFLFLVFFNIQDYEICKTPWLGNAFPRTLALGMQMPHPAALCCDLCHWGWFCLGRVSAGLTYPRANASLQHRWVQGHMFLGVASLPHQVPEG